MFDGGIGMKKKKFSASALVRAALGLLLSIGMFTFLGPCAHMDGGFASCHWAGQMLAGLGIGLTVQALISLFVRSGKTREGISLSMIPVSLLAALVPGGIIPLCSIASMRCNMIMKPASILIAALIALLSLADAIAAHRRARQENKV